MDLDVVTLSRAQFGLTVMFHYLFPPLSIGLGLQLVIMEGTYLFTKDPKWEALTRFFTKLFAVNFAVGVATGIVMEFQFGTNWATYSRFVGDVFGAPLASEGIFAFFLESGFLAVLVFGWDRVSPRVHMLSTVMVFLGSVFSSVWIVIANSWMQTPAGYHLVRHGDSVRAEITDFWAVVFNPSSMNRLTHVLLGAFILGAFFVTSIMAFYYLRGRHQELARRAFTVGLGVAAFASCAQLLSGHTQARAVAHLQPTKLAAFEGHYHTGEEATGMYLLGWPDDEAQRTVGLAIPGLLSYLVYGDDRPVAGLDQVPVEDWPPVNGAFQSYHIMAALGTYFIALSLFGLFLLWRKKLFTRRWILWIFVVSVIGPYIANECGWVATELGRQPWIVYGLLRTSDAVSASVPAAHVLASIIAFSLIYIALGALWLFVMNEKIKHGIDEPSELAGEAPKKTSARGLREAASALQSTDRRAHLAGTEEED